MGDSYAPRSPDLRALQSSSSSSSYHNNHNHITSNNIHSYSLANKHSLHPPNNPNLHLSYIPAPRPFVPLPQQTPNQQRRQSNQQHLQQQSQRYDSSLYPLHTTPSNDFSGTNIYQQQQHRYSDPRRESLPYHPQIKDEDIPSWPLVSSPLQQTPIQPFAPQSFYLPNPSSPDYKLPKTQPNTARKASGAQQHNGFTPMTMKRERMEAPGEAEGIVVKTKFPVARIKRIVQADEDVGKVAQVTPVVVSKALELFMISLTLKAAHMARSKGSKRITAQHLRQAVFADAQFDFLSEIVGKIPEAPSSKGEEKAGKGEGGGGVRKREDSEDDWDGAAGGGSGSGGGSGGVPVKAKRKTRVRRTKTAAGGGGGGGGDDDD